MVVIHSSMGITMLTVQAIGELVKDITTVSVNNPNPTGKNQNIYCSGVGRFVGFKLSNLLTPVTYGSPSNSNSFT